MNRDERRRQITKRIAYRLYQRRLRRGYEGSSEQDWRAAEKIARSPIACSGFWLNQWLKGRWRKSISWYESTPVEHALETLTEDLKNLAVFDLLALLANLAIIISLGAFLTNGERQRHDQQVYEAWQVITNAHGQPGNGGRRRALEFLNSTPGTPGRRRWFGVPWPKESLQGVDVSKASLNGIELPGASLGGANLRQAYLDSADFQETSLAGTNLQQAVLIFANLQQANLVTTNLQETSLGGANLQQAILYSANLQQAAIGSANLRQAFLENANLQQAFLASASLQDANLRDANLRDANLRDTNLQQALLLATDLRASKNLTNQQLITAKLCHVALPDYIQGVDPIRDCEIMPEALVEYYNQVNSGLIRPTTLESAKEIVEEARQKEWNALEDKES